MLKAATLLLIAFLSPLARGTVIATEAFAYASGTRLTGTAGGTGWSSPWLGSPLNSSDNAIGSGGLSYPGLPASGNRLTTVGGDVRSFRKIDTNAPGLGSIVDSNGNLGRDGTTIWIGFLARLASGGNSGNGGIHLYDGLGNLATDPLGDKSAHERIFMGDRNSAGVWCLERTTGGAPGGGNWDSTVPVDGTLHYLVYRLDFRAGTEEIRLFVDPPIGA
ncbi:MAG TPA: hypothetical protein VGR00_10660, partial [Thermoanaerobaculia bacterium]|nr:hypothetical protein [Thermoanaerobaculia bacterium]